MLKGGKFKKITWREKGRERRERNMFPSIGSLVYFPAAHNG